MVGKRRKKIGEILLSQGLIAHEQLLEALEEHKRTGVSLGTILVKKGFISEDDLSGVLGQQIQLEHKKRIGEVLIDQGLITQEQLEAGLLQQKKTGWRLGTCLVKLGFITEEKLIDALSAQLDIQHVVLENFSFNKDLLKLVPEEMVRKYKVIPLFEREGVVTFAMADPTNLRTVDHLKFKTGMEVEPVIATEQSIMQAVDRCYSDNLQDMTDLLGSRVEGTQDIEVVNEADEDTRITDEEGQQVVKIVNLIVNQAVQQRASDIHLEPLEKYVRLRYRIDGELVEMNPIPLQLRAQITSRIKIMAGMDIAERRKPQDGHFQIRHQGREIDLRVSTFPIMTRKRGANEKIVLRVIDQSGNQLGLDQIGFTAAHLRNFDDAIIKPDGILLVTGPTGSGKSSTLYAALRRLGMHYGNKKNIVTMEDPVEYVLDGLAQGQINPKAGFTFAEGIRSILRQDPDIIMIGEMRDFETCEMAIQAALTGHLVFSTLHTNDAASAYTRLMDMGIEPFLIASTVIAVLAQRLVRRLCQRCMEPYVPEPEVLQKLGLRPGLQLYRGKGCSACNNSGYKGRTGIFEFLIPDQEIVAMVLKRASSDEIKRYLLGSGAFDSLRRDGLRKVVEGITSLEQVLGATQNE
ncbi:MAG: type II/IV secretion system protein [Chitinivibrionales bacterium]|nr:type II/IV secretion system protein [Chitinivibrionales bacterium]